MSGGTKLASTRPSRPSTPRAPLEGPDRLFPKVTEAEEQRAVARAKLGFYNLLFLSGQIMALRGPHVVVIGPRRLRRTRRRVAESPQSR
jgi:hypothetical protein